MTKMDCVSLELVANLSGHQDRVWSVAWSPKGDYLASCSGDKTVRIWTRRRASAAAAAGASGATASSASACAPSRGDDSTNTPATEADAKGAASSGPDGSQNQQQQWYCCAILDQCHSRTIRNVAWSPNGRALATASFDATVSIWELSGGVWEQVAELEGHENEVKCVAWNPDGRLIATCGRDRSVWIWESMPGREFECVDVKQGHTQDVKVVQWHPGGELLVSAGYDDTIKLWTYDGDEWGCSQTLGGCGPGSGHSSTVWDVCWEPGGQRLATCSDDLTVKLWESKAAAAAGGPGAAATGGGGGGAGGGFVPTRPDLRCATTLSGYHPRTIFSLDWGPTGLIATGDGDDAICIFGQGDPELARLALRDTPEDGGGATARAEHHRPAGQPSVAGAAADEDMPDASAAAGGLQGRGPGGALQLGQPGQPWALWLRVSAAHDADVNCVRWNPAEPRLLASCSDDGRVRLWWLR